MSRAAALVLFAAALLASPLHAQPRVVTTSRALADLTRSVAGPEVEVQALMRGPENPHNLQPTPSLALKLRKADLFVHLGLDAEPWVPALVRVARRPVLLPGGAGNVDASRDVPLLGVPKAGETTRAFGDIHVHGNPHYLLDPRNGITAARTIAAALERTDPANAARYTDNFAALEARLGALSERLTRRMAPYRGTKVVTYHRTWPYFLARFGLEKLAEVEPKPGIAPGPRHIATLAERMRAEGVRIVIVETFSDQATARRVAARAGAQALVLAQDVGALGPADTYERLFEHNVALLLDALEAR